MNVSPAMWRVAARSSSLSRLQTAEALSLLGEAYELVTMETPGDRDKATGLLEGEAPADFFTRDLHQALRDGGADFAVHSAKDLDLPLPRDIQLVALLAATDQSDALVCRQGLGPSLADLPSGARVATSSPSRRDQLLAARPDLQVVGIRGTIEERLAQVDAGSFDAVIVATCALKRLNLSHRVGEILPFRTHPLQGHLAVTALVGRADVGALWSRLDVRRRWGRVFLVGAGPGDPELLTLRARRLIDGADLILTDSLANAKILEGVGGEIRFVGKRGDAGGEQQALINEALHEAARRGVQVVRLKGGDPMVFGRATEELEYLEARLVEVELVPGISSAQGASHYTQIPLTERGVSASVAFCLGAPADRITVPTAETLVYYMASATLTAIVSKLIAAGRSGKTPVALVRNASLPDQRVWYRSLGGLAAELEAEPVHPYASPLLLMVGDSARDRGGLSWFERLPRVWYTGTRADRFLRQCRLVHHPLIATRPLEDSSVIDRCLAEIADFEWVVFPSRPAVEAVFSRVEALGLDARAFASVKLAAVGHSTARDLKNRGLVADLVPAVESAAGLIEAFRAQKALTAGAKVWLPCSDQALPDLKEGLGGLGAVAVRTDAYRTVETEAPALALADFDEVVLTSPSSARAFHRLYPEPDARVLLVPMGAQTRRTLGQLYPARPLAPGILE